MNTELLLKRIDTKLSHLLQRKEEKATWVKSTFITQITGWDKHKMRSARNQNIIQWKKTETGFWYLLESVPEQFIIRK